MLGFLLWDLLLVQPWPCLYSHFSNLENNYVDRAWDENLRLFYVKNLTFVFCYFMLKY